MRVADTICRIAGNAPSVTAREVLIASLITVGETGRAKVFDFTKHSLTLELIDRGIIKESTAPGYYEPATREARIVLSNMTIGKDGYPEF